jgi:hypothetical protein
MITIGLLSYRKNPIDCQPSMRLRALLAEAALQGASFVMLNSSNYDLQQQVIQASIWTEQSVWRTKIIELPDAIIIEGAPLNKDHELLENWVRTSRPVIADYQGGEKSDIPKLLVGTPCEKYIIPWSLIPRADTTTFLRNYFIQESGAVVKRTSSNSGIGIFFIKPDQRGWIVSYNGKKHRGTVEEVAEYVSKRIAGRLSYRDYIAQRYIKCNTSDGRPFDVRIHVQRCADKNLDITRGYVRLAEVNSPLPNTSCGGYQGSLTSFLAQRDPHKAEQIESELRQAAINIAYIQDASHALPLSELGLDFLIDEDDVIWLVETNVLPGSSLHEQERAINTIGYAISLAANQEQAPTQDT